MRTSPKQLYWPLKRVRANRAVVFHSALDRHSQRMNMAGYWRSSWCSCTSFYELISACWQNRGNKIQTNCCGQHLLKKRLMLSLSVSVLSIGRMTKIKILAQWGGTGENYTSNIIIIANQDTSYLIRLHIQTGWCLVFCSKT